jgi:ATP-binding cassette subfamily B protein
LSYKQQSDVKISLWHGFKSLAWLWPYLKPQRHLVFLVLVLVPLTAGIEATVPLIMRKVIDRGVLLHDEIFLIKGVLILVLLTAVAYLTRLGQMLGSSVAILRMILDLRSHLIDFIVRQNAAFHDQEMSGVLTTRMTSDFDGLSDSLNYGAVSALIDLISIISALSALIYLSPQVALINFGILPVALAAIFILSKKLQQIFLHTRQRTAQLDGLISEYISNEVTLKTLSGAAMAKTKMETLNSSTRQYANKASGIEAILISILDGLATLTVGLCLWYFTATMAHPRISAASAGEIVAALALVRSMFDPLKQIGGKIAELQGAFTSIRRIFALLDQPRRIGGTVIPTALAGKVTFENVCFKYDKFDSAAPVILRDITFKLEAGQSLAITGPSGAGKSTLIKILLKLYEEYDGVITLDGHNLKDLDPFALRGLIGMVPQSVAIFNATVLFNITLNNPAVSLTQVEAIMDAIGGRPFIESLPAGYETILGADGRDLSVGQKQLLAIARTLVKNPPLIIFDEATSSIDPVSEGLIQNALDPIMKDRTVIIIAHRKSTTQRCQFVAHIADGKMTLSLNPTS